jgi:hypothetical protein
MVTTIYILNRSPSKALNGRTPYEAWLARKSAVSHLQVFGCLAFGKELGHIGKLDDRSTPWVFIRKLDDRSTAFLTQGHSVCARRTT